MTKKEMIKTIEENEKEQWELLCTLIELYGAGSMQAEKQRSRWAAINVLCGQLGIEV